MVSSRGQVAIHVRRHRSLLTCRRSLHAYAGPGPVTLYRVAIHIRGVEPHGLYFASREHRRLIGVPRRVGFGALPIRQNRVGAGFGAKLDGEYPAIAAVGDVFAILVPGEGHHTEMAELARTAANWYVDLAAAHAVDLAPSHVPTT